MEAHDKTEASIVELLTTYNELNSSRIEELNEEPSPLEFMRYVARNIPLRGAARRAGLDCYANVGCGVPTLNPDRQQNGEGHTVFAKPHEEDQEFGEFLEYVMRQEKMSSAGAEYQARRGDESNAWVPRRCTLGCDVMLKNDNLRHEYISLFSQVEKSIAFARIALDRDPDAINMWIGNSRSVTALHRDNYENIYVQIAGRKHFVLLPPLFQPCVNEQDLDPATYIRLQSETRHGETGEGLVLRMDETVNENGDGPSKVPFATWDPDTPEVHATPYSYLAEPMRVSLEPGDMLYLPAMW
ncbi:hypothetical protein NUW58_g8607 [Xylaria curta]|uniref:Uncharacterized protein n=1 Tax=Xylaria curta TaxID=42375 RepID=A0ACC1N683_9PEZI|nr:hypothetical protein NUW58_g8607 [Xylaria curta]